MEVILSENQSKQIREQLTNLINDVITERIERIEPRQRYFTRIELQKFLNIGNSSMEILKANGLRYAVLGNRHLFDIEDVYSILNELKQR